VLRGLDHVVIAVRDLAEARGRYARLLGRDAGWRGRHPGLGTANALFDLGGVGLELLAADGGGPGASLVARSLESRGEGLLALAFATDAAAAASAALRARGVRAGDPRPGSGEDPESGAVRRWRTVDLPLSATRGLPLFAIEREASAVTVASGRSGAEAARSEAQPSEVGDALSEAIGLDHVVVTSADLEASRAVYADRLGLRLALDRRFEDRGLRMLFFRVGGVTLEVVGRLGQNPDAAAPDAFGGLAYRVGDADAARARVAAAGFEVSPVRDGARPGTRVCSVRGGTCGVPTLLIEVPA